MKKCLLIVFLLLTVKGFAQISLEYTFNPEIRLQQVSSTEWDYYSQARGGESSADTVTVYSINHAFVETFIVPCPSNQEIEDLYFLSKNLFSTSGKFDVLCQYQDTNIFILGSLAVVQDDGTTLLAVDSAFEDNVYNTTNGTKLLVYKRLPTGYSSSQVYSLPGYNAGIPRPQADVAVNNAYPNPTDNVIHLPYNLNGNAQGELDVVNMQGQQVKQFKIGNAFSDILLNTTDLPKGSYLYYITTNGQQSKAKQFVVQ